MMAEGRMDLFRQMVGNMVIALGMPPIDNDDELDDLTIRTGHTGKVVRAYQTLIIKLKFYSSKTSCRDKGEGMPQVLPISLPKRQR
jgi:hypothetical protein